MKILFKTYISLKNIQLITRKQPCKQTISLINESRVRDHCHMFFVIGIMPCHTLANKINNTNTLVNFGTVKLISSDKSNRYQYRQKIAIKSGIGNRQKRAIGYALVVSITSSKTLTSEIFLCCE